MSDWKQGKYAETYEEIRVYENAIDPPMVTELTQTTPEPEQQSAEGHQF